MIKWSLLKAELTSSRARALPSPLPRVVSGSSVFTLCSVVLGPGGLVKTVMLLIVPPFRTSTGACTMGR